MALKKLVLSLLALSVLLACSTITGGNKYFKPSSTPIPEGLSANPKIPTLDVQAGEACADFDNGEIAFTCPPGWELEMDRHNADPIPGLDFGGEFLAGVVDPGVGGNYSFQRGVLIFRYPLPPGATLDQFQRDVYASAEHFYPVDQRGSNPTIAGQQAVQSCYRIFWGEPAYEFCDTWLAQDEQVYLITGRTQYTNPEDTAQAAAEMQSLVDSFHFVP